MEDHNQTRLPATIVEVTTPHEDAPEVHHTPHSGIRVKKGKHSIKWSDGHTE